MDVVDVLGDLGLGPDHPVGVGVLHLAVQVLFGQGTHGGQAKQAHRQEQGDLHPHGPAQQRGNQGHQRPGGEPDGGEPHGGGLAGGKDDQQHQPYNLHHGTCV